MKQVIYNVSSLLVNLLMVFSYFFVLFVLKIFNANNYQKVLAFIKKYS